MLWLLWKMLGEECRGSGLYPQTLFHFTDKNGLLGILESNFKITYSLEKIECQAAQLTSGDSRGDLSNEIPINRIFGAPMVSFCDLRLSELRNHMRDYGSYGIGLSKRWAVENGVNPVYYVSAKSGLLKQYIDSMAELFSIMSSSDCEGLNPLYHRLLNFYRYMKNYDAPLYRKGRLIRASHRFANEREWRYVPPIDGDLLRSFVPKDTMEDPIRKAEINDWYKDSPLVFHPSDIKYIVVKEDNERAEIVCHIDAAKHKYETVEVTRLKTRIVTMAQIEEDV